MTASHFLIIGGAVVAPAAVTLLVGFVASPTDQIPPDVARRQREARR